MMAFKRKVRYLLIVLCFLSVRATEEISLDRIQELVGIFKREMPMEFSPGEAPEEHHMNPVHRTMTWAGAAFGTPDVIEKRSAKNEHLVNSTPYWLPLDVDGKIGLHWGVDRHASLITFVVTFAKDLPAFDWFSLGWSDSGEFTSADFCLLFFTWEGKGYLQDSYTDEEGKLHRDQHNDCLVPSFSDKERELTFKRVFDTCDDQDYIIEDATTHILWAIGEGSHPSPADDSDKKHRGMVRAQLIKGPHALVDLPLSARALLVAVNGVHVPDADTTYWCYVQEMPEWLQKTPHHIIRFESQITKGNEGLVHHMEVFHCDAPADKVISAFQGSCSAPDRPEDTMVCTKVNSAWAMGAGPFIYPEEAGLPIGGPKTNKYIMLEVHYNNPEKRANWVDSSGVLIHMTPELRKYNASIMELGLEYTDKMAIPPGQEKFQLSGYCTSDCTNTGLPSGGITVFGSQLHTHLTGTKVETRHFRNGVELPLFNGDNHYSSHFQEIRLLKEPITIQPGDFLVTTCDFKTVKRENMTFGGHSITDEMCLNYIHYYPASNLELCKSSVGNKALNNYFHYISKWENVNMSDSSTIREKYGGMKEWTPARVDFLNTLYQESKLSVSCNQSDGSRFPGQWENVPQNVIVTRLPKPKRNCPNIRG